MARITINELASLITTGFEQVNTRMDKQDAEIAQMNIRITSLETAPAPARGSNSKKSSNQPKADKEMVPFTKHDGTVVMCSKAQAEAWAKWQSGGKSKDELAQMSVDAGKAFKPTKKLAEALKVKPTMSRDDARKAGFDIPKGFSGEQWREYKKSIGVYVGKK